MKIIIKLIINKLIISCLLTFGVIVSIFFTVSLLGNLGENYNFKLIFYLSLLSSIQIFFYIPLFIYFLVLSHFNFSLKTFNELTIIRHYVSLKKITFVFVLFSLIFLILEINKELISQKIELYKINLTKKNTNLDQQIYIIHNSVNDRDYVLILDGNREEKKIVKYKILNNHFNEAIYSNKFFKSNQSLIAKDYFKMSDDKITFNSDEYLILDNINKFTKDKINHIGRKKILEFKKIFPITYLFFLFILILIILMGKQSLLKGYDKIEQSLVAVLLIFYSYIILNFNLTLFIYEFQILSILFLLLSILKKIFYEKSF